MSTSTAVRGSRREPSDHYIQSLARGLAVIRTFGADTPKQALSEVAARAGIDRAGARRILLTLKTLGYVRQDGRFFSPTPGILHLGYSYLSTLPWWSAAERKMVELAENVNESAALGVLAGAHIVSVVCVHAPRNKQDVNLILGRKSPAHCTALGRVLLGALPQQERLQLLQRRRLAKRTKHTVTCVPTLMQIIERDRRQGWSFVNREYNESVCSIAVPVYTKERQIMGAMSVSESCLRTAPEEMVRKVLPHLKRTVEQLWD